MERRTITNEVQRTRIQLSRRRVLHLTDDAAYSLLGQMDHTHGEPKMSGEHFVAVLKEMVLAHRVEMVFDHFELVCYLVGSDGRIDLHVSNDPDRLAGFVVRNNNINAGQMLDGLDEVRKDRKAMRLAALN